jgi:thioredoxin-dependent peroxiredoxin
MRKNSFLALAVAATVCIPAFAALKMGDRAPDFSARASLAGKEFAFSLRSALEKGPVVLYFYPSAYTGGCDVEAHTFAQQKDQFDAAGATIIGVSADSLERLNQFSADPNYCAGRFPVASDPDGRVAALYNLTVSAGKPGQTDVRGIAINHDFIERETFVIGKDQRIIAAFSSKEDHLTPDLHVKRALEVVQQIAGK